MITVLGRPGSASARALSRQLRVSRANPLSRRTCRGDRFVINWGCSQEPVNFRQRSLVTSNSFLSVARCVNKIATLDALGAANVPCLRYTRRHDVAEHWRDAGGKVVVRHVLNGHSGQGIEIVRRGNPVPEAPLYTEYFVKRAEYRVHVFYGRVILIQQKRRRNGAPEQEGQSDLIRTHDNGWVFTIHDLSCDTRNYRDRLSDLAIAAALAVGTNHCAVDILVNHDRLETLGAEPWAVVCEINSAPGLTAEASLTAWSQAFTQFFTERTIR